MGFIKITGWIASLLRRNNLTQMLENCPIPQYLLPSELKPLATSLTQTLYSHPSPSIHPFTLDSGIIPPKDVKLGRQDIEADGQVNVDIAEK
jgi:hypothetical protein